MRRDEADILRVHTHEVIRKLWIEKEVEILELLLEQIKASVEDLSTKKSTREES